MEIRNKTDKELYEDFSRESNSLPIYMKPWWLDAVALKKWDVVVIHDKGVIKGAWVFVYQSKLGLRSLTMPILSSFQGPYINYPPDQKFSSKLSFEKKILTQLIDKLPSYHYLNQRIHPRYTNWLPLYWKGFKQTTRYTYQIRLSKEEDELWDNLDSSIRRAIKKARNKVAITIEETNDIELFLSLNKQVFDRQGISSSYSQDDVLRLNQACETHEARQILIAKDESGVVHAALYLVFDEQCTYYIMGGSDPNHRSSGAISFLMWHAIMEAKHRGSRLFDFEGSMIEPIENFFNSFGTEQVPYFNIKHFKNKVLELFFTLLS